MKKTSRGFFWLLLLLLLSWAGRLSAQQVPTGWIAEDSSDGGAQMVCRGDTLEIVSPGGLTLWRNERLAGDYEISYRVCMVMKGGKYDRLSDLNCFWGAVDPSYPDDLFARGNWRNGIFSRYNTLNLFYVGFGGNYNTTTRFRQYHGKYVGVADDKVKPLLAEYTDEAHLLKPNRWYEIRIRVKEGQTSFWVDGERLFHLAVPVGATDGYFALRLLENHVLMTGFTLKK